MASDESEDHLAWEARQRTSAAIAAAAAGLLTFLGTVWRATALGDLPTNGVLESLDRAAQPGEVGALESLRVNTFEVYDEPVAQRAAGEHRRRARLRRAWAGR